MRLVKRGREGRFPSNRLQFSFALIFVVLLLWFWATTSSIYFPYPGSQLPEALYVMGRDMAIKKYGVLRSMDLESYNVEVYIWLRTKPNSIRSLVLNGMLPNYVLIRQSSTGYTGANNYPWLLQASGFYTGDTPREITGLIDFGDGEQEFRAVAQPPYMFARWYGSGFSGQYSNVWYLRDALPALERIRLDFNTDLGSKKYERFRFTVGEAKLPTDLQDDTIGVLLFPLPKNDKYIVVKVFRPLSDGKPR